VELSSFIQPDHQTGDRPGAMVHRNLGGLPQKRVLRKSDDLQTIVDRLALRTGTASSAGHRSVRGDLAHGVRCAGPEGIIVALAPAGFD